MEASRLHALRPGASSRVHHDEHPFSFEATVVLGAVALRMEMTVCHEIFISDSTRLDHRCAPKKPAFSSVWNGGEPLNSVNDSVQIHAFELVLILKEPSHLPKGFHALAHIESDKAACRPVNAGNSPNFWRVHRNDGKSAKCAKSTNYVSGPPWSFSPSRGIKFTPLGAKTAIRIFVLAARRRCRRLN